MKDLNRPGGLDHEELARRRAEAMASIERTRLRAEARGMAIGLALDGMQATRRARLIGPLLTIAPGLSLLLVVGGLALHFAG